MKRSLYILPAVLAAVLALGLTACDKGSAEKAGEKMDSSAERAMGQPVDVTDGAMENAGEAMDEAAHDASVAVDAAAVKAKAEADSVRDAVHDATKDDRN